MNTTSIRTDLMSVAVQQNLSYSANKLNQAMSRLATGSKINSAADNAANFALSSNIKTQTSGLSVANGNIKISLSTLNNLDSSYSQLTGQLQKLRALAVQAANGTYSPSERNMIGTSSTQLINGVTQSVANTDAGLVPAVKITGFIDNVTKISEADAIQMGYDANHIIKTASEFKAKIMANLSGNFILANDIDMSGLGTLTGSLVTAIFAGKLDGNGCTINNLNIDTQSSGAYSIGLFAFASSTTEIKNLGMKNLNVIASGSTVVGGLVGRNSGGTIINASIQGNVVGGSSVGVIAGECTGGTIVDSNASGSATAGGRVGGLVGQMTTASISNSNADVNLQGGNWSTGGLVGQVTDSNISNSNAGGAVNGLNGVGGLAGTSTNTLITNASATGSVQGTSAVGGFIGQAGASTTIADSYATGSASGTTNIGGFFGQSSVINLSNSYSSGKVTGSNWVGGLIGRQISGSVGNTNYWDKESSGRATSSGGGVGVTTGALDAIKAQGIWANTGYTSEVGTISVQIGTNGTDTYTINDVAANIDLSGVDLSTVQKAKTSISMIDQAISAVSGKRTKLGTGIKILESMLDVNNNRLIVLNQENSTIKDADVAEEVAEMVKQQILQQTNVYLLNENKNRRPQLLLSLISSL